MKKLTGVIALLLSIVLFLILRQLTTTKAPGRKATVSAIMRENILLSSILMQ